MRAPRGRKARVRKTERATAGTPEWNSVAMAGRQKTRRKKSRESRDQLRKAARKALRCGEVSWRKLAARDMAGG